MHTYIHTFPLLKLAGGQALIPGTSIQVDATASNADVAVWAIQYSTCGGYVATP